MKPRKSQNAEPSLRDKLGEKFLHAIQSDFEANGAAVIEQLRLKSPEKYTEIAARLIAATEPAAKKDKEPTSTWEFGKMSLIDLGANEYDITHEQIELAVQAHDRLMNELTNIIAMKASFETEIALMKQ